MKLLLCSIFLATSAFAGSGGFIIRAKGLELGEAKEMPQPQPPRFSSTIRKGKIFTLEAHGTASSRGEDARPFEPDSGEWAYDRKMFQAVPVDKKTPGDKTVISIRLKASKAGKTQIRFAGKVLGYENKFDVDVEVK